MGNNKILIAGLVGGIVSFLAGFLIFGVALAGFAEANGGAVNAARAEEDYQFWAIIVGALASGFLLAYIFGKWAGIKTLQSGAISGAILGLLIGIYFNFIMYGTTEMMNLTQTIVNSIAYAVLYAIVGAVVALMLGRGVPALEEATA